MEKTCRQSVTLWFLRQFITRVWLTFIFIFSWFWSSPAGWTNVKWQGAFWNGYDMQNKQYKLIKWPLIFGKSACLGLWSQVNYFASPTCEVHGDEGTEDSHTQSFYSNFQLRFHGDITQTCAHRQQFVANSYWCRCSLTCMSWLKCYQSARLLRLMLPPSYPDKYYNMVLNLMEHRFDLWKSTQNHIFPV